MYFSLARVFIRAFFCLCAAFVCPVSAKYITLSHLLMIFLLTDKLIVISRFLFSHFKKCCVMTLTVVFLDAVN
ncbi:hypothetical protein FNI11_02180 [Salmonella enterica subsp. salamae]|nr:hypothetical protein [Salmonella enterica subsp. salamae]ECJ2279734.1 hypothetical protein [Salmonella enterica subsp. salamae]